MTRYCLSLSSRDFQKDRKDLLRKWKDKGRCIRRGKNGGGGETRLGNTEGNYITQDQYTSSKRNQQGQ